MKENKNEKLSDDIETKKKSGKGIFALTTTVMNLPNEKNVMPVREFEDMFSNKEKNEVLRVLDVNGEEVTDEKAEKMLIIAGNSITFAGDVDAVCRAESAV